MLCYQQEIKRCLMHLTDLKLNDLLAVDIFEADCAL